ncbi:MAG: hypothetical protein RML45_08275 [Acetobacteraceae bacterium]|nr:hypothetical protein [Acetobacteraceae bacterium]
MPSQPRRGWPRAARTPPSLTSPRPPGSLPPPASPSTRTEIARLACLARRAAGLPAEESLLAVADRAAARGAGLWALRALVDAAAPPARLAALLAALGLDATDTPWPDLAAARRALSHA